MNEPSVLDFLKAKLTPWRGPAPAIPGPQDRAGSQTADALLADSGDDAAIIKTPQESRALASETVHFPWRPLAILFSAVLAQRALEPPDRGVTTAILFYTAAFLLVIWSTLQGDFWLARPRETSSAQDDTSGEFRLRLAALSIPFAALAYWAFQDFLFNPLNLFFWGMAVLGITAAFWSPWPDYRAWPGRIRTLMGRRGWDVKVSYRALVLVGAGALIVFFRLYRLAEVPPEMISDHAEKLLDVADVLDGQFSIYFPRNTGREALQMYLTAGVARLFDTGVSFLSLKIGTALAGLVTLPFVYLLGKEVGNRNVGLFALLLAGMAYWPNVTSRIALRFTLYALFVAPTLYYLIRGLRTGQRNNFILAGIALGLGLHGYSSFRIVPFVILTGIGLFWLHNRQEVQLRRGFWGLVIIVLVSFAIFLPLFRYAIDNPEMFSYRTMTRIAPLERPLDGPAWQIFLQNLWKASIMFFWSNGTTWVHSVTLRPALDVVSAALYALGVFALLWRYVRQRHWVDLFLLVSIPLLLMPSIISLAFPDENPSLNRTTGAWVPVFVIAGLALDGILAGLQRRLGAPAGKVAAMGIAAMLVGWSATQNYDLVFNQYARQYQLSSWNTTEVGHVVRAFADSVGTKNTAWVVGFPHWVDTRLVGINAGYPRLDNAIWPDQLETTLELAGPKLFILKPEHQEAIDLLRALYPAGQLRNYNSRVEGKDFRLYLVPP